MAEKLCPECQKLVIPSTGQNKNAGRGVWLCFAWRKTARLNLGSLQMPKIWKGWSQWGRGKNTNALPPPIQAFLHLGCRLFHAPKVINPNRCSGIIFSYFPVFNYHSSQCLTKLFQLKGQPLQKGATSAFIWALTQSPLILCAWLDIFCLHRNLILKMFYWSDV